MGIGGSLWGRSGFRLSRGLRDDKPHGRNELIVTETDLVSLYRNRFAEDGREKKIRIWNILCKVLFQSIVGDDKVVLDLACGYGEFINSIAAQKKYGVDLNPDAEKFVGMDVSLLKTAANRIPLEANSVDVVFTSNFLEHLKTKEACNEEFLEIHNYGS
jgi:SAM-dependent methyltransferase